MSANTARSQQRYRRYLAAADPDGVFLDDMRQLIEQARTSPPPPLKVSGDRVLRVLLLGYAGAGNTGADIRTIETIRQLQRMLAGRPSV